MRTSLFYRILFVPFCLFLSLFSYSQIIKTIAGNGQMASAGDGGAALDAALFWPEAVAVDGAGNVYISEIFGYRIRRINPSGVITTIAGNGTPGFSGDGGPATQAQIRPRGIAIDHAGNIYIADQANYRIRKINAAGTISTIAGNGSSGYSGDGGTALNASLNGPKDIALDPVGNLYISEQGSSRIRKVDTNGIISLFAGDGNYGYSGDGGPAVNARLSTAISIAADNNGNVFIDDFNNHCIRKVNQQGIISTIAGNGLPGFSGDGGPAINCELNEPRSVAVDDAGNLYIADQGNYRIRKINTNGMISTIGGNGVPGFGGDGGAAVLAQFENSVSLDIDPSGNIFIVDQNNNRARRISATTDHTPPQLMTDINVTDISCHSARFSWTTNEPSSSFVSASFNNNFSFTAEVDSLRTQHTVVLEGLNPGKTYSFFVRNCDASGNCSFGYPIAVTQFSTTANPGPAGPVTGSNQVISGTTNSLYSIAAVSNAIGYAWTVPDGASYVSSADGLSIRVNWGNACSGQVRVKPYNECAAGTTSEMNVAVREFQKPVVSGPENLSFCYTPLEYYTVDPLVASDNCGIEMITYTISGATHRSGNGPDASGILHSGTSIIMWMVKDLSGNTSFWVTLVKVSAAMYLSIPDAYAINDGAQPNTVYPAYTPASAIRLRATVAGGDHALSYLWSTGAVNTSIQVAPALITDYWVTVTDGSGCSQTVTKTIFVEDIACSNGKIRLCIRPGHAVGQCVSIPAVKSLLKNGARLGDCMISSSRKELSHETIEITSDRLKLSVYPNPFVEELFVKVQGFGVEKIQVVVYDAMGRIVLKKYVSGKGISIGQDFKPGVYLVEVSQGNEKRTVKVIRN